MKISVVMPIYNERVTLREVIHRVLAVSLDIELPNPQGIDLGWHASSSLTPIGVVGFF